MTRQSAFPRTGASAALGAALLFGAGTPLAKLLLQDVGPWMLAGLFYLGSGVGLTVFRLIGNAMSGKGRRPALGGLERSEVAWLAGAILAGGVAGPVLLMFGLAGMPASGASLLLNAEGVFTALLAWIVFRENVDRRIALGMAAIALGSLAISWPEQPGFAGSWPALAVLGACLAWAIDNNLTRKVSLADAAWIAAAKGLAAGAINLGLAVLAGDPVPDVSTIAAAMTVGFFAYGLSLTLFVVALRHLGTARTGAYFSVAPFFGAVLALASGEPGSPRLAIAGALMAAGVWMHLTERHEHEHRHHAIEHAHEHGHDEHHEHDHADSSPTEIRHSHRHRHEPIVHTHAHFPDAHHRDHEH